MPAIPGRFATNVLPVVIAVILWLVGLQSHTFTVEQRAGITPPEVADGLVLCNLEDLDSVTIVFEGRGARVLWDQLNGFPETVSLINASSHPGALPASIPMSFDPGGIRWRGHPFRELAVTRFEPAVATALVDSMASRIVAVEVSTVGQIPSRYLWQSVDPPMVTLDGPAAMLSLVDSVGTSVLTAGQQSAEVAVETDSPLLSAWPSGVEARVSRPVPVVSFADM